MKLRKVFDDNTEKRYKIVELFNKGYNLIPVEYVKFLENKLKESKKACYDCYEIYAGMEEPIPKTAYEKYLIDIIYQMRDTIKNYKRLED